MVRARTPEEVEAIASKTFEEGGMILPLKIIFGILPFGMCLGMLIMVMLLFLIFLTLII